MFRVGKLILSAIFSIVIATPTAAQSEVKAPLKIVWPMPSDDERAAVPLIMVAMGADETVEAQLSALDKALAIANKPTAFRGLIKCQQTSLLNELPDAALRVEEAAKECIALLPDHPMAQTIYAHYQMGRDIPGGQGLAEGVDSMTILLRTYPDIVAAELDIGFLHSVLRRLRYAKDQRRLSSLVDAYLASGIAKANDLATDELVLLGMNAVIADKNWDAAKTLLPQLKTRRAVEGLLLRRDAEPIWEYAARYYHGDLDQRRNLFELDTWRSAGGTYGELTTDRAIAMAEHGEWEKLREDAAVLIAKQREDYDFYRGENFAAALSAMFRGQRADLAIPLGLKYFAELGDKANENLNAKLTLGYELVKAGRHKEGLPLIEQGYAHWKNNQSLTEGGGGQMFMSAVRACAKGTAEAEAAFARIVAERANFSGPYRAALECRNEGNALANYFEHKLNGDDLIDRSSLITELRRVQAGQPERLSPAIKKALASKKVVAALDAFSRPWSVATVKPVAAGTMPSQ